MDSGKCGRRDCAVEGCALASSYSSRFKNMLTRCLVLLGGGDDREFEAVAAASVASKDVIITDEPSLASVQGRALSGHILVPFPPESCLSGASGSFDPATTSYYWYRLPFRLGQDWDSERERLLLHFGAVDWQATVWVNGEMAGTHQGGYVRDAVSVTTVVTPVAGKEGGSI